MAEELSLSVAINLLVHTCDKTVRTSKEQKLPLIYQSDKREEFIVKQVIVDDQGIRLKYHLYLLFCYLFDNRRTKEMVLLSGAHPEPSAHTYCPW